MNENNENGSLYIGVIIVVFLYIASLCALGVVLNTSDGAESIGGFIDLCPSNHRYTKDAIIGGRAFRQTDDEKSLTIPEITEPEKVVIKEPATDDECIDTNEVVKIVEAAPHWNGVYSPPGYYEILKNVDGAVGSNVQEKESGAGKDSLYEDAVSGIELYTYADGDPKAWVQDADIDLFRNQYGRIEELAPGTDGFFRFQLNNRSGNKLHIRFSVKEPENGIHLPMVFNLENEADGRLSANTFLGKEQSVDLEFDIDKDKSGLYRLNWEWPYESGNDAYDISKGMESGKYILDATVYAEVMDR